MKRRVFRTVMLVLIACSILLGQDGSRFGWPVAASPFLFLTGIVSSLARLAVPVAGTWLGLILLATAVRNQRFFCRWFCPMGCLLDECQSVGQKCHKRRFPLRFSLLNNKSRLRAVGILFVLLALMGSFFGWYFTAAITGLDPLVLFTGLLSGSWRFYLALLLLVLAFYGNRDWCVSLCPLGVIQQAVFWKRFVSTQKTSAPEPEESCLSSKTNYPRRQFLGQAIGLGLTCSAVSGSALQTGMARDRSFYPPGALSAPWFSSLCLGCGRCIAVCPTGHLLPLRGTRSPLRETQTTYCQPDCNACSQVCPTGAIQAFTPKDKSTFRLGTVVFDPEHCVLYASKDCHICVRECPYHAIKQVWSDEYYANMPHVDPHLCNGCGRCVVVCPGFDPVERGSDETENDPLPKAFTIVPPDLNI